MTMMTGVLFWYGVIGLSWFCVGVIASKEKLPSFVEEMFNKQSYFAEGEREALELRIQKHYQHKRIAARLALLTPVWPLVFLFLLVVGGLGLMKWLVRTAELDEVVLIRNTPKFPDGEPGPEVGQLSQPTAGLSLTEE